jgi:hypothetical protein
LGRRTGAFRLTFLVGRLAVLALRLTFLIGCFAVLALRLVVFLTTFFFGVAATLLAPQLKKQTDIPIVYQSA